MWKTTNQTKQINSRLLNTLHSLYTTDPLVRCVRQTIISRISRDKIRCLRGGRTVQMTKAKQLVFDSTWAIFIEKAFDCALVNGVVVWFTVKNPVEGAVPVVAAPGSFILHVELKGCRIVLSATPTDPDFKKKLNVFDGFGWTPDVVTAAPCSPMIAMYPVIELQREMLDTEMKALASAANPTLVTQQKMKSGGNSLNSEEWDMFVDSDAIMMRAEDRYRLNRLAIEQSAQQKSVYARFRDTLTSTGGISTAAAQEDARQLFPLPTDHELARQLPSVSNHSIVALLTHCQEQMAGMVGIPRHYLLGASVGRASKESDTTTMVQIDATINWWRARISQLLTEVYFNIYSHNDAKSSILDVEGEGVTRKERVESTARGKLETDVITVQLMPDVSGGLNTLKTLFTTGVIDYNTFSMLSLRAVGLSDEGSNTSPKDALSAESRKRMLETSFGVPEAKRPMGSGSVE